MQRAQRIAVGLAVAFLGVSVVVAAESGWFVPFERVPVAPVARSSTAQLVDGGTVETDGFAQLEFSLGGEFKEGIPEKGTVGALLIPDMDPFLLLFRTEGQILAALEVKITVGGGGRIFLSKETSARIAFPRYRVFFYNETSSGAVLWLYLYKTRCAGASARGPVVPS